MFVHDGPDIVGLNGTALAWSLLVVGVAACVAMITGLIAGLVSLIGALLNTLQLERKTWFVGLLPFGIFNLGFFAMIANLIGLTAPSALAIFGRDPTGIGSTVTARAG